MDSALSGEAVSTNTQYSGAAMEGPAANTAILATSGPQQPQVHDPTTAAPPAVPSVIPARSSTRQWRAMREAFNPMSVLNNPTTMSCPGDVATKRGIWGRYISSVGYVTSW